MATAFIVAMVVWHLLSAGIFFSEENHGSGCFQIAISLFAVTTLLVHLGAL